MISQTICSWFSRYVLLILLINIKIWKPVETKEDIDKSNAGTNNIEVVNQFRKVNFPNRIQSKHFDSFTKKIQIPPSSFLKSASSSSSLTKQKYVGSTRNENTKSQEFMNNFAKKYKSNNGGVHKINSNVDSSILSPGAFYGKYSSVHMRASQASNTESKLNDFSSQPTEQKNLKDGAMINPFNNINKFENQKSVSYADRQKYSFSNKNNTENLLDDPELADLVSLYKILKNSNSNFGSKKVIQMKEKSIVTESKNERTGAKISSQRLHNTFQITGSDNQEMQLYYTDKMNVSKQSRGSSIGLQNIADLSDKFRSVEYQKEIIPLANNAKHEKTNYGENSMKIQTLEGFNNKFNSFQDQKSSFNLENNLKPQSLYLIKNNQIPEISLQHFKNRQGLKNYEKHINVQKGSELGYHKEGQKSNWEMQNSVSRNMGNTNVQTLEGFNDELHSSQDRKNTFNLENNLKPQSLYLIKNSENSRYNSQYLTNDQGLENYEDKSDVRKEDAFGLNKAGQQSNWNMQNNVSRNTIVEENSDTMISKDSGESYKSNQKNYVQIFKVISRHNSLDTDHKVLQENSLEQDEQKKQANFSIKGKFSLLTYILVFKVALFILLLVLLCCSFHLIVAKKCAKCSGIVEHRMLYSKLNKQESSKVEDSGKFLKGHIQIDIEDSNINHLPVSNNLKDSSDISIKNTSMKSGYDSTNQEDDIRDKREKVHFETSSMDKKYYYEDSETAESSKSSKQETSEQNRIHRLEDSRDFLKDDIRTDIKGSGNIIHSAMSNNLNDTNDICVNYDSIKKDSEMPATLKFIAQKSLKDYETENSVESSWDLHLQNVKSGTSFNETLYKVDKNDSVHHRNYQYANSKNMKDDYFKKVADVTFSSPKYSHDHSQNFETNLDLHEKQNAYSMDKTVHKYLCSTDSKIQSLRNKIGSPWHRNLVNVETKSIILFQKNDTNANKTLHDLMTFNEVESNSMFAISPAEADRTMISTADIQSVNKMHCYRSIANSQDSINNRTAVTRDACFNTIMIRDSTVNESVESKQNISDSSG